MLLEVANVSFIKQKMTSCFEHAKFEVIMVVKTVAVDFWVVMPHSVVIGYHCFRVSCCLYLQGEVNGAWIEIQIIVFWVTTLCNVVTG